jgi:hypothetical protein
MSTLNPAITPAAVRSAKWNPPWLVIGLTAVLIPLVLLWSYLGSHFTGGDGKMYLTVIDMYLRFAPWGDLIIHNPLQGAWNVALPANVWINPAAIPFHFLPLEDAKIWSGAICFVCYAASWYLVLRSAGVAPVPSASVAQFAFISFDPFYYIFGTNTLLALGPWRAPVLALTCVVASLLLRISDFTIRTIISYSLAVAALVMYSILLDPLFAMLAYTMMLVPCAVIAWENGFKLATAARCLVGLLALAIVFALGPGRFLLAMATNTSRYLEPEFTTRPGVPDYVSTIFQYSQSKYCYGVLIVGWLLGLALVRGRARLLPIIAVVSFATQFLASIVFLFVAIPWSLPIPIYYEEAFMPWYVIGAGVGYAALIAAAAEKAWFPLKSRLAGHAQIGRVALGLGAVISLSIAPGFVAYQWAHAARLLPLSEPWSGEEELVSFLGERLSLVPDSRFRGSAVITIEDYLGSQTQDTLLRAFIPTLNEYSQFVTEPMFVTLHELTANGRRLILNRLPLAFDPRSAESYVKVTGALGARFVLSREPLDGASLPPGMAIVNEQPFISRVFRTNWYVYQLPATNTGNYSPTVIHQLATAPEMLKQMASPAFDYRREAVVSEAIGQKLVPLNELTLTFERGAARVRGSSDGTSLALLPLQYSHCLQLSDPNARLIRSNVTMTGLLFKGSVDAKIAGRFGIFTPGCRAADIADIKRLNIGIVEKDYLPSTVMHPTAIRSIADVVPNVTRVLDQIK